MTGTFPSCLSGLEAKRLELPASTVQSQAFKNTDSHKLFGVSIRPSPLEPSTLMHLGRVKPIDDPRHLLAVERAKQRRPGVPRRADLPRGGGGTFFIWRFDGGNDVVRTNSPVMLQEPRPMLPRDLNPCRPSQRQRLRS